MSTPSDGELRVLLRRNLRDWHWSILDGATSSGAPDLAWGHGGRSGLTELKATTAWAVSFRPSQLAWHTAHAAAGGAATILVRRWRTRDGDDELWMFRGEDARLVSRAGLGDEEVQVAAIRRWAGGPQRWPWPTVASHLHLGR